jgi:type II secretory pathway component PulC
MMFPPPAPPPPPAPLVEISMTQPKPAIDAISCSQEHRCTIDRAYVMELVANPSALVQQMRIIPSVKDGQAVGLKLYGIRHGSLPNLLGYKNGDLILSINGMPVNSPEAALGTYSRLRSADTFSVELERKGQRLLKTCDLR